MSPETASALDGFDARMTSFVSVLEVLVDDLASTAHGFFASLLEDEIRVFADLVSGYGHEELAARLISAWRECDGESGPV